jgi:hypothetical protein
MAIDKFSINPGQLPSLKHTISSTENFTVPVGVQYMYILAAGGGGNTGAGANTIYGGNVPGQAGGGSGGVAQAFVRVTPGETLVCVVGGQGGTTSVTCTGAFPFRLQGNGGTNGSTTSPDGAQVVGAAGTVSISPQALSFANTGIAILPTVTIGLGSAPNYSGAGLVNTTGNAGLTGGGTGNAIGGTGLAGTPTGTGGAGITGISNTSAGGTGGGGAGGPVAVGGTPAVGGSGAIRIYY